MFNNHRLVVICDMEYEHQYETGDEVVSVKNAKKIVCTKDLVGIQTQQLAQSQNMFFNYSVVVDRMFYNQQKYIYMENEVYEIKSISPAKLPKDCKLNVSVIQDARIKNAIQEWLSK